MTKAQRSKVATTRGLFPDLPLLHRSQVPVVYREPFLIDGYRQHDCSYLQCLKYCFVMHNDVGNFWTHFLPPFVWLPWLYVLSRSIDFTDPYFYPLLCFWIGACSYSLFSSLAHALGCKSATVQTVGYMLDYHGISIYGFGGGIVSFFYLQPSSSTWAEYKWPFLILSMIFAVSATFMCSSTRFFWHEHRFVLRILSFVLPYLTTSAPFAYRLKVCVTTGNDCVVEILPFHFVAVVLTIIHIFFYVSKIPERFAPGKFDFIGQSHQLFHISGSLLTSTYLYLLPLEAVLRKGPLSRLTQQLSPDVYSTFIPYLVVEVLGLITVAIFGILMSKRVLISNVPAVLDDVIKSDKLKEKEL